MKRFWLDFLQFDIMYLLIVAQRRANLPLPLIKVYFKAYQPISILRLYLGTVIWFTSLLYSYFNKIMTCVLT